MPGSHVHIATTCLCSRFAETCTMSVNTEKSHIEECREQIDSLKEELSRLNEQLKLHTDDVEREKLELLIGDIHAKIEIKQIMLKKPASNTSRLEPRKSSRERELTPKMLELKQQEFSQKESKFIKLYESWKEQVKATRSKLKDECSDQELADMMDTVEGLESQVKNTYEDMRSQSAPSTETRRKIDSCTAVTADLMRILKVRMSEVGQEEFDAKAENARLHMVLDREYARSIFGTTISRPSVRSCRSSCLSEQQSINVKKAECAAQLAAKQAEIEMEEARA